MNYIDNLEVLKEKLNYKNSVGSYNYNTGNFCPILPFLTNGRASYEMKFDGIAGAFARCVCNVSLDYKFDLVDLSQKIVGRMTNISTSDSEYLKSFIEMYLYDARGKLNLFSPEMLRYITVPVKKSAELKIATFLRDTMFHGLDISVFQRESNVNSLERLILESASLDAQETTEKTYIPKLKYISDVCRDDYIYLCSKKEMFTKYLSQFLSYYYFYYCCQLSLAIIKREKADVKKPTPFYYLLDWEIPSVTRDAYIIGFRDIKEFSTKIISNINLLEHVNAIQGEQGKLLPELLAGFELLSIEERQKCREALIEWIIIVRNRYGLPSEAMDNLLYIELIELLYDSISMDKTAFSKGTGSRYGKNLTEAAKIYFTKSHGKYGELLNINQELLVLFVEICLKGGRLKRNDLFEELEKRGLFFDKISQNKIIEKLESINMLEKKSDSGDAQYVKSIL
jgi:DNA phosphorothioation-dependent restriction protein DptG